MWSQNLDRPSPSTSRDQFDATPSTNDSKKKGNIIFPYRLYEGEYLLHLLALMDKASKALENLASPQSQCHVGYKRICFNPLIVGKEIDLDSSLSFPSLLERDSLLSVLEQNLVEKSVDLVPPLVSHSLLEESSDHTAHILLVSSDSH